MADETSTPVDILDDWGVADNVAPATTQVSASDDADASTDAAEPTADAGSAARPSDTNTDPGAAPEGTVDGETPAPAAEADASSEAAPEPDPDTVAVLDELAKFIVDDEPPAAGETTGQEKAEPTIPKPEEQSRSGAEFEALVKAANEPIPNVPPGERWVRVHPSENWELAGVVHDLNDQDSPYGFPGADGELRWFEEEFALDLVKARRANAAQEAAPQTPAMDPQRQQEMQERAGRITASLQAYGLKRLAERAPFIDGSPRLRELAEKAATALSSLALGEAGIGLPQFFFGDKGAVQASPGQVDVGIEYFREIFEEYDRVNNSKQTEARQRRPAPTGVAATPAPKPVDQMTPDEEEKAWDSSLASIRAKHRN